MRRGALHLNHRYRAANELDQLDVGGNADGHVVKDSQAQQARSSSDTNSRALAKSAIKCGLLSAIEEYLGISSPRAELFLNDFSLSFYIINFYMQPSSVSRRAHYEKTKPAAGGLSCGTHAQRSSTSKNPSTGLNVKRIGGEREPK
jgi:hypothetical protein